MKFYQTTKKQKTIQNKYNLSFLEKLDVVRLFRLHQLKGMLVTAAMHIFCNQASKLCSRKLDKADGDFIVKTH